MSDQDHRLPNMTSYANMDQYYKTQFQSYQNMGKEFVFGGISGKSNYRANVHGNNYAVLKELERGEAAFYSKTCKK